MTESEIKQEAEKAYPDTKSLYDIVLTLDEVIRFAKHCVDKATGWRPIAESMPEPWVRVLMRDSAHVFVEQWWGEGYLLDHRITHWMPIPQLPEAA